MIDVDRRIEDWNTQAMEETPLRAAAAAVKSTNVGDNRPNRRSCSRCPNLASSLQASGRLAFGYSGEPTHCNTVIAHRLKPLTL